MPCLSGFDVMAASFSSSALRVSKIRPFVLYSIRHTFLTRLGESGCDVWTLARIAGHSSIVISARYVHPSSDAVLNALARLESAETERSSERGESKTGDKTGDSDQNERNEAKAQRLLTQTSSVG